jgi:hypothetical protein
MRTLVLVLALVLGGCAAKKPPRQPGNVEHSEKKGDLDKDKDERNGASPDDKDDHDPKRGGDPCEGGE